MVDQVQALNSSKISIALIMGYLQVMGSSRFVATAAQLLLFGALCTAKPQGFQTTGKLVCILGPTVSTTSSAKKRTEHMSWFSKQRETYIGAWRRGKDYFDGDAFANRTGRSTGPFRCW
jgi:hypothetical protein